VADGDGGDVEPEARGRFQQLAMGGVAERAGVSSATLDRRCSSKEELVVGALACLVPGRPAADTGSLDSDLREMLRRMGENMSGEKGRLLLGLAGEIIRHAALAGPSVLD
jgi:AcrR family transcriptional regulator